MAIMQGVFAYPLLRAHFATHSTHKYNSLQRTFVPTFCRFFHFYLHLPLFLQYLCNRKAEKVHELQRVPNGYKRQRWAAEAVAD